jgi:hypothetical protein
MSTNLPENIASAKEEIKIFLGSRLWNQALQPGGQFACGSIWVRMVPVARSSPR